MRFSDWSSDVFSSDLGIPARRKGRQDAGAPVARASSIAGIGLAVADCKAFRTGYGAADIVTAPIHVAASNIHGLGASQLVQSLLPALATVACDRIGTVLVPETGPLGSLAPALGLIAATVRRQHVSASCRESGCQSV